MGHLPLMKTMDVMDGGCRWENMLECNLGKKLVESRNEPNALAQWSLPSHQQPSRFHLVH